MTKATIWICFCASSVYFVLGLLLIIIMTFHMENPAELYAVQNCTGGINYAQAGELIDQKGHFIDLSSRMFPFLMLVWAIGNWYRVYRFQLYNSSGLWKYRYR